MPLKKFGPLTQIRIFTFTFYGTMVLFQGFLPLFLQFRGFDMVQIGILMSIGPVVSIFANPFWGLISDRHQNTRDIIMLMMVANLAVSVALFYSTGFVLALLILVAFYFFQTALSPINSSLILQAIEGTNVKFGNIRLWGSIGYALLAVASGPVIRQVGIGNYGWVYIIFLLAAIFLSTGLPQKGRTAAGKFALNDFSKVVGNGAFVSLLLLSVLVFVPYAMNSAFLPLFIQQMGGTEISVGSAYFFSAILEVPVFLALDRYMPRTIKAMLALITLATGLFTLRWLLMGLAMSPLAVIALQMMHSVTFGIYMYNATLLSEHLVPKSYRATGQSLYALSSGGIAGLVAGYVGGRLFQLYGPHLMYLVGSLVSLAGLLGYILMWILVGKKAHTESTSSYSS